MRVTTDPRCPKHPRHAVWIRCSRYDDGPAVWVCAACHRPLGCASLNEWGKNPPWPQGRKETPIDMTYAAIDWSWMLQRVWKDYPQRV